MMSYFGLRDWKFDNTNINSLSNSLIYNNENKLQFDMATIDWNEYFLHYLPGIKKYFFKESYENIDSCKKHYQRYVPNMVFFFSCVITF